MSSHNWPVRVGILLTALLSASAFVAADQTQPLETAEALAQFVTHPDVRVELVAAEPEVVDPVALAFDEAGRMYVVEDRGYPTDASGLGRVALLEDRDGDGRYESRTTFADGLAFPNGVMPWDGGIFVTDAPALYYFKDTDGDGVADVRRTVLEGFSEGGSTQLRASHPTLGIDNWIHLTNGLSGGEVRVTGHPEIDPVEMGARDLRYNPLTHALELTGGRAQFGLTFNDFGHKFICSNRNHVQHVVMQPEDISRNPHLIPVNVANDIPEHGAAAQIFALSEARTTAYAHAGTFTAACGLLIYRGTGLPKVFYGNSFVCEPTGNLIHRDVLEPRGASYVARRGRDEVEFLATRDNWFRPVFLANGPGGALYVCDMYRKTIEHPTYLPPEVAEVTDFYSGNDRGRIYRITAREAATPKVSSLEGLGAEALVDLLAHPNGWHRDTAHRLLLERQAREAVPALRELAQSGAAAAARVHALSLLSAMGALSEDDLRAALTDRAPEVRAHAAVLRRGLAHTEAETQDAIRALATDPDGRVRFDAALALGDSASADTGAALLAIAQRSLTDSWTRHAVLGALPPDQTADFAMGVLALPQRDAPGYTAWLAEAAALVGHVEPPEGVAPFAKALIEVEGVGGEARFAALAGVLHGAARNGAFPKNSRVSDTIAAVSADAAQRIVKQFDRALRVAADATQDPGERAAAIGLLTHAAPEQAGPALAELLTPKVPQYVQLAAVRALDRMNAPEVGQWLTEASRWRGYTGVVQTAALQAVLSRADRAAALLDGIEAGRIPPYTIDPVSRTRLENHRDDTIKNRARHAFANVEQTDRSAAYQQAKSALDLKPDTANGKAVFERVCATCHTYGELGHEVGPDLTGIRSQPLESILLHIIDPNSLMLDGYENYVVETTGFETISGLIVNETPTAITVRGPNGVERTIARDEIDSVYSTSLSLMPEELEESMTHQELRDLLGFLKGGQVGE